MTKGGAKQLHFLQQKGPGDIKKPMDYEISILQV
jgi:hypothetical protein